MEYKKLSVAVRLTAGIMLLLALADWPYSYYQILRIVVCASSLFLIWYFKELHLDTLGYVFIIPAVLFNPIIPIYLDKQLWHTLDVAFGLFFLVSLTAKSRKRS